MPFNPPIPDPTPHRKRSGVISSIVQAEKMVQIALILPSAAFIGWLPGAWIGSRIHQPWPGAVGVVLGGAAGLYCCIRMAMDAVRDPKNEDGTKGAGKGTAGRPS